MPKAWMDLYRKVRETVPCRHCKVEAGQPCRMLTHEGKEQSYIADTYIHKQRLHDFEKLQPRGWDGG